MRHKVFVRGGHYKTSLGPNGGEATGPVLLHRDPEAPLEAATKQYVDSSLNNIDASAYTSGTIAPERLPAFSGDIIKAEGSSIINVNNIGVPAGSYTRATVNIKGQVIAGTVLVENDIPNLDWIKVVSDTPITLSGYGITDALNRTNPTMTGTLKVNGEFTQDEQLVNKQYVDETLVSRGLVGDIDFKLNPDTPAKYLRCNGGEVSKTMYAELYSVVGDTYTETGSTKAGTGKPWKQQYDINSSQSTDITGWTTGPSLPGALGLSQAIITKNRVYLLGGYTGDYASIVYTAPINEDGTLGSWTTGTSLPGVLGASQAIITKNRVYLLGGSTGTAVNNVYTAPINEDGTLGAWTTGTSLPVVLGNSHAIVTKNRVYLLGGIGSSGGNYTSTVYTAPINEDGTLGTWVTGTNLPGPLTYSQAIVTKNRVYLLGGRNGSGSNYTNIIYTAPINEDGTLGTWTTGTSLPGGLGYSQAIVTKNRVYLLGGYNSNYVSTVYTAPINEDGTLGAWTTGPSLPGALGLSQAIVTKSRVYLLGGNNSGWVSTVYTAPFSGGLNDYSQYYNGEYVDVGEEGTFKLPKLESPYPGSYSYIRYSQ